MTFRPLPSSKYPDDEFYDDVAERWTESDMWSNKSASELIIMATMDTFFMDRKFAFTTFFLLFIEIANAIYWSRMR